MKFFGIVIFLFGFGLTIMTGFNLNIKGKLVDLAKIETTKQSGIPINWPPLLGIALMIAGGGLFKLSENERFTNN